MFLEVKFIWAFTFGLNFEFTVCISSGNPSLQQNSQSKLCLKCSSKISTQKSCFFSPFHCLQTDRKTNCLWAIKFLSPASANDACWFCGKHLIKDLRDDKALSNYKLIHHFLTVYRFMKQNKIWIQTIFVIAKSFSTWTMPS